MYDEYPTMGDTLVGYSLESISQRIAARAGDKHMRQSQCHETPSVLQELQSRASHSVISLASLRCPSDRTSHDRNSRLSLTSSAVVRSSNGLGPAEKSV